MKSPLYYHGYIYESLISLRHGKERLKLINTLVNKKRVLELGCGTGVNGDFLECDYCGYDLNHNFIKYGKKKKRNVNIGDVFKINLDKYDVILIVDVLHHIPGHKDLMKKILSLKKEVIVCEPFCKDFKNKSAEKIFNKLNEWVDSDGINKPVKWYKKEELKNYFKSLGTCEFYYIGEDIIAHYKSN